MKNKKILSYIFLVSLIFFINAEAFAQSSYYSIQVFSSYQYAKSKSFIQNLNHSNKFLIFNFPKGNNKYLYKVIYGKYKNYRQAKEALKVGCSKVFPQLCSKKLLKDKPYILKINYLPTKPRVNLVSDVNKLNTMKNGRHTNDFRKKGFYLAAGVGYIIPRDVRQTSNINASTSLTPTVSVSYPHVNDNVNNAISQVVGLGYRWGARYTPITWRAGIRLTHFNSKISGRNLEDEVNYQYKLDTLNLSGDFRITLWLLQRLGYYAEASLGFSRLSANDYKLADLSSSNLIYANKTRYQFSYGGAIGLVFALSKHDNIDVSVGYYDYGVAKLGEETSPDITATGTVEERLHALNTTVRYVHYF